MEGEAMTDLTPEAKQESDTLGIVAWIREWDGGDYDGQDYLRRVRLALHGARGLRAVGHNVKLSEQPEAVRSDAGLGW